MVTALFRTCLRWSCKNNMFFGQGASLPSSPSRPRSLSLAFRATSGKYIPQSCAIAESCSQFKQSRAMVLRPIKLSAECEWTALPTCKVKKYLFPAKSEKRPFRSFSPGTSDYFNHRGLSHSIFFVGSWNHNSIGTSLSSLPQLPPFHTEHLPYKTYTIIESPSFSIFGY